MTPSVSFPFCDGVSKLCTSIAAPTTPQRKLTTLDHTVYICMHFQTSLSKHSLEKAPHDRCSQFLKLGPKLAKLNVRFAGLQVTIGTWITGHTSAVRSIGYMISQLCGSIVGCLLLVGSYHLQGSHRKLPPPRFSPQDFAHTYHCHVYSCSQFSPVGNQISPKVPAKLPFVAIINPTLLLVRITGLRSTLKF